MTSEVLIIGGGVIGLSIARELHKQGAKRISIVEKGVCGEESSWAAAGMLGPQAEADSGGSFFDMTLASRDLYPDFAAELEAETGIDVGLDRSGTFYFAFSDEDVRALRERYEWQKKAGFPVELLTADEARRAEPFASPSVREALFFPGDWQVDNRKLLAALRKYAEINGIQIIKNTTVERLIVEGNQVVGVEVANGEIRGEQTVLATGAWTSLIKVGVADMPFKVEPVRGQIIAFHTAKQFFKHVVYTRRGYIVPRSDGRLLVGSTTEFVGFEKTTTAAAADLLREIAGEIAPSIGALSISDHWSGLRPFAADGLPVLGSIAGIEGLTIATAHYRNGILLAPLTARIVADRLIGGGDHPAFTAFGPDRFRFAVGSMS
ncbi:MAG: glycine oxidase ThiO [Acidobacteria bacterium]|nr:glycine oxidase ThiO [Acidobacteriota bacterium]